MSDLTFPKPFVLDRTRSAAAQVLEFLRENIVNLTLQPATPLDRQELARQFDLSQTPIRDALLRLEEEGLVDIYPQRATVVRRIDVKSARRAHFLRQAIELEVVRALAASPSAELASRLAAILSQQANALECFDFPRFVWADQTFHRMMYEAAGVEPLWDVTRRLSGNLNRLRHLHVPMPGKAANVIIEHQRILDAVANGDLLEAEHAVRSHLTGTLNHLDEIREQYSDFLLED
ncbi:GntR family transcriptional regulator [Pseudoduganella sp. LjRoot289]|uniref:GntR family transcriptional regulator n=1 Tax=Pseudoduganella sp. LjRoot289 TaxID=3342314 RepID=UPI003ECFAFF8